MAYKYFEDTFRFDNTKTNIIKLQNSIYKCKNYEEFFLLLKKIKNKKIFEMFEEDFRIREKYLHKPKDIFYLKDFEFLNRFLKKNNYNYNYKLLGGFFQKNLTYSDFLTQNSLEETKETLELYNLTREKKKGLIPLFNLLHLANSSFSSLDLNKTQIPQKQHLEVKYDNFNEDFISLLEEFIRELENNNKTKELENNNKVKEINRTRKIIKLLKENKLNLEEIFLNFKVSLYKSKINKNTPKTKEEYILYNYIKYFKNNALRNSCSSNILSNFKKIKDKFLEQNKNINIYSYMENNLDIDLFDSFFKNHYIYKSINWHKNFTLKRNYEKYSKKEVNFKIDTYSLSSNTCLNSFEKYEKIENIIYNLKKLSQNLEFDIFKKEHFDDLILLLSDNSIVSLNNNKLYTKLNAYMVENSINKLKNNNLLEDKQKQILNELVAIFRPFNKKEFDILTFKNLKEINNKIELKTFISEDLEKNLKKLQNNLFHFEPLKNKKIYNQNFKL